jgi:hypothetical protein
LTCHAFAIVRPVGLTLNRRRAEHPLRRSN